LPHLAANKPANHKGPGFVAHAQQQNTTYFVPKTQQSNPKKGFNVTSEIRLKHTKTETSQLVTHVRHILRPTNPPITKGMALWHMRNSKTLVIFVPKTYSKGTLKKGL